MPRGSPISRRWEAARSRGHVEIRRYLESLQEDWIGFRHEPEGFFDAGDMVVAFLDTYAQGRGSGADVEMHVAHVLRFAHGKCLGYVSYGDRDEAMRIAGLEPTDDLRSIDGAPRVAAPRSRSRRCCQLLGAL